jgi:hypothetical protein
MPWFFIQIWLGDASSVATGKTKKHILFTNSKAIYFLFYYSNTKVYTFGHQLDTFPPGMWSLFTEELQSRPNIDYEKEMVVFKNKRNNTKRAAKKEMGKMVLQKHASPLSSAVEKQMALLVLLNDRLQLDLLNEPAPWDDRFEAQRLWVLKWRDPIESNAGKKAKNLDDAVMEALVVGPNRFEKKAESKSS